MKNIMFYFRCMLCCAFIGLFSCLGYSQEPGMWHITDQDGLPSMTVYDIAQDNQGYMWMGTAKGICRFDGKTFKYYNSKLLKDSEILKVSVDQSGKIWFSNLSGQLFFFEEDNIIPFSLQQDSTFDNYKVENFEFLNDQLYLLLRQSKNGKAIFQFAQTTINARNNNVSIDLFPNQLFLYTNLYKQNNKLYFTCQSIDYSKDRGKYQAEIDSNGKVKMSPAEKRHLNLQFIEGEAYYFVDAENSELIVKKASTQPKTYKVPFIKKGFNAIVRDNNDFWILSRQGIGVFSLTAEGFQKKGAILENITINRLEIDAEGNKWLATTGSGIYVITAKQTAIYNSDNFNFPSNDIYSLEYNYTNQDLLIGFDNGGFAILDENENTRTINLNEQSRVVDILIDHLGYHWLGTDIRPTLLDPNYKLVNAFNFNVKSLLQVSNTDIWTGRFDSAIRFKYNDWTKAKRKENIIATERMIPERTYALFEDLDQQIWIGTASGIYTYKDSLVKFTEKDIQVGYNTSSITQTTDSAIWIGTRGSGLLKIKEQKVIDRFSPENGLASNTVNKIFADKNHLWIGTDNGVNKLNIQTGQLDWINKADGLPSLEINDLIIVGEEVWLGTPRGLVNFATDASHVNETAPPIFFTAVSIEEKDTLLRDSYKLKHDQNSIQLAYAGISYHAKGNISYQYRLSGIDKNWVSTEARVVRYPNLPPGTYDFEIFAVSEDNIKSKNAAKIEFTIQQAWWKTNWFYALCFLALLGTIALIFYLWLKRKRQEQFFQNHVNELKTQALRSQMNPHFIFNSLNAIQQFLTTNDREQAMHYLGQFAILIRLIFEQSQREKITLEEELEFLNLYLSLEKLRFMDAVKIELAVAPDLLEQQDEIKLPALVVQPIIENSFKHGFLYKNEEGVLRINFSSKGDYIECTISDNGIGRKKAAELGEKSLRDRPSSGLKTARERLQINNEGKRGALETKDDIEIIDLENKNGTVAGTLVKVHIYCKDLQLAD